MNLSSLHRRLLADVMSIGSPYPLVITGGYAVQAHGLVDRLSQDIDVATENPASMDTIAQDLHQGLADRGWQVNIISVDPLSARLVATSPDTGESCEVDILKENFWTAPQPTEHGPVLAIDDVIGTKVRALADRGAARDLIDVHAAADTRTLRDLERLGERHGRGEFRLQDLRERLSGAGDWTTRARTITTTDVSPAHGAAAGELQLGPVGEKQGRGARPGAADTAAVWWRWPGRRCSSGSWISACSRATARCGHSTRARAGRSSPERC